MKVTITLELTPEQVTAVMALLSSPDSHTSSSEPKLPIEVQSPSQLPTKPSEASKVTTAPTPGKGTKMPAFGRSQQQVDTALAQAAERQNAKAEAASIKQAKKAKQEAADAEALAELEDTTPKPINITMPTKPWRL